MTRPIALAAVDVGTNSVLLTIARRGPDGRLLILDERCVITRLGRGLGERGALDPAAAARTLEVLEEFGRAAVAFGAPLRAAGTSALRRADDGASFLEQAGEALGAPLELLSGVDEARLGWLGAMSELPGVSPADGPILVDPGGGSTEVVRPPDDPSAVAELTRGDGDFSKAQLMSLEIGAVRLTESFLSSDPPDPAEIVALRGWIDRVLEPLEPAGAHPVVAAGGSATTLAAVDLGLERYDGRRVHGHIVTRERLVALSERLVALPTAEREKIPCVPPGRADVAPAGAFLLIGLLDHLEVNELIVTDRGLRFGLLAEMLEVY